MKTLHKGFTLIEILVVIGIIAILAAIVVVAVNPARQFAEARNSQRQSNVESILNAVGQNIADNKGIFKLHSRALPPTASTIESTGGYDLRGASCQRTWPRYRLTLQSAPSQAMAAPTTPAIPSCKVPPRRGLRCVRRAAWSLP